MATIVMRTACRLRNCVCDGDGTRKRLVHGKVAAQCTDSDIEAGCEWCEERLDEIRQAIKATGEWKCSCEVVHKRNGNRLEPNLAVF